MERLKSLLVLSNLAYVVFGVAVMVANVHGYSFAIGGGLVLLGLASGAYHTFPDKRDWQHADEMAMYASIGAIAGYNIGLSLEVAYPLIALLLILYHVIPSRIAVPSLVVVAVVGALISGKWLVGVLAILALGYATFIRFKHEDPHNMSDHWKWHILSALGLYLLS